MSFIEYATPVATPKYSPQYFASLTFLRVQELDYPKIATSSIVKSWSFTDNIPSTALGTVIQPGELVPFLDDVLPISREMAAAFAAGSRAVRVRLSIEGHEREVELHFSKIRVYVAINNHSRAIAAARELYLHIVTTSLLSRVDILFFSELRIFDSISGFDITSFPLWKLSCLLGETWLEEDVLNALLELQYLQETSASIHDPSIVILPTTFSSDLQYLSQQNSRSYSRNLHLLRRRLRAIPSPRISFAVCRFNHYTAYHYTARSPVDLVHGDSLGGPAATDVMPSFCWFIQHTGHSVPLRVSLNGIREIQGPQSGSCGVAVVNFIQCRSASSRTLLWTDETSPNFRNKAIQDLIVYHFIASIHKPPRDSWTTPCAIAPGHIRRGQHDG
ncbi:hypothetical protein R3P38DRAFT_2811996 [Favolaschia claudopus]|uniref:Uncharacterized protein n=1 Tax=Favolaschia claudopus TaxID=2862362 RepID=A0AAV9Z7T8_9AGAR